MGLAAIDPHSQKEQTKIKKIPSLLLIRPVLTDIQRFKKRQSMAIRTLCSNISLLILTFSNGCIFLTIGSIYTKLGDFVKLGLRYDYVDQ